MQMASPGSAHPTACPELSPLPAQPCPAVLDQSGTKAWVQVRASLACCLSCAGSHVTPVQRCHCRLLCQLCCLPEPKRSRRSSLPPSSTACASSVPFHTLPCLQFVQHVTGFQHCTAPPLFGFSLPMSALLYLTDSPRGKLIAKQARGGPGAGAQRGASKACGAALRQTLRAHAENAAAPAPRLPAAPSPSPG